MASSRSIKAFSFLWISSLLGAGFAFLSQVILARALGAQDFGIFSASLAAVTLFVPLAGFGVAPFWLKAFGEEGWKARRWWRGSFRFVSFSTAVVVLGLGMWSIWGPHDDRMSLVIMLLLFHVLGQLSLELVGSRFQLEEKYLALAIWQFLPHFIRLIFISFLYFCVVSGLHLYGVALIYSGVAAVFFVVGTYYLRAMCSGGFDLKGHGLEPAREEFDSPGFSRVWLEAWPFGAGGVFYLIYFQSAVVLLGYLSGAEASGIYNVAFVIMTAVYLFPSVLYQKFLLPKIHRWANSDLALLAKSFRHGNFSMATLGVLAMLVIWLCSSWGIPLLFGTDFEEAVLVLNILAIAAPFRFLATSVGSVLVTKNNMRRKVGYMGGVALFNFGINVVMIPLYGVVGAAISTVFSDALLLALYSYSAQKYVFRGGAA